MKKSIFTLLIGAALFSACSKTDNSSSNPNKITLNDNGYDYAMTSTNPVSNEDNVNITLIKTNSSSALIFNAFNTSSNRQFAINLKAYGSYTGSGIFTQSNTRDNENQVIEYYPKMQTFNIDSSSVTVTTSTANHLEGTYLLWMSNANGKRTASGYFSARNPSIQ